MNCNFSNPTLRQKESERQKKKNNFLCSCRNLYKINKAMELDNDILVVLSIMLNQGKKD
jgi:hypothetical protein